MSDRPCRKCNCPLAFVPNGETGKELPLDTRASVYAVFEHATRGRIAINIKRLLEDGYRMGRANPDGSYEDLEISGVYVTHFASCPKANSFSKGGRSE